MSAHRLERHVGGGLQGIAATRARRRRREAASAPDAARACACWSPSRSARDRRGSRGRRPDPSSPDRATSMDASACAHGPCTSSTVPRSRSRAASRETSPSDARPPGRTATTGSTSAIVAVTASQRGPGSGISTSRDRSTPSRSAASAPNCGMPTTPHHDPACEGAASSANRSDADEAIEYAEPGRSPPPGRSAARAGSTGSTGASSRRPCTRST